MTAATITYSTYGIMATPGIEVVLLEASEGETYVAHTLSRVDACLAQWTEDQGASTAFLSTAISGTTVTIHSPTSITFTDKKVSLVLFGA